MTARLEADEAMDSFSDREVPLEVAQDPQREGRGVPLIRKEVECKRHYTLVPAMRGLFMTNTLTAT